MVDWDSAAYFLGAIGLFENQESARLRACSRLTTISAMIFTTPCRPSLEQGSSNAARKQTNSSGGTWAD
jgi:hypothetical protein